MPTIWRRKRSQPDPHRARLALIESMRAVMAAKARVEQERLWLARRASNRDAAYGHLAAQLYALELVLERVYLRLNTLVVGGYLDWRSLALTAGLVRQALGRYGHLSPDITSQLARVEADLTQLWASVEPPVDEGGGLMADVNEEVQKVLREAELAAQGRVGGPGRPTPVGEASSS